MLIVIADDITGAAELGGIALRYGLRVLLSGDVVSPVETDVLVVYTNTRSMPEEEAVKTMASLTQKAKALQPELFYKKTDSVLRGHVLAEMKAQMTVLKVGKGLLVPVNPSLGRTIRGGHYFVNGQLVHEAGFANDPEFPIRSSRIEEMLSAKDGTVHVIAVENNLPQQGIAVGEAQTAEDVAAWASVNRSDVLFAGGASFFDALLRTKFRADEDGEKQKPALSFPLLFVSGTTYQKNTERIRALSHLACYMPDAIFLPPVSSEDDFEAWSSEAISRLQKHEAVILTIGEKKGKADANLLREKMSEAVKRVVQKTSVKEMLIEGGSTAFSILQKLGWQSFVPTEEWAQGVVRMRVLEKSGVHLTIKPGSYEWPHEWNLQERFEK